MKKAVASGRLRRKTVGETPRLNDSTKLRFLHQGDELGLLCLGMEGSFPCFLSPTTDEGLLPLEHLQIISKTMPLKEIRLFHLIDRQ